ncbi:MAG: hypothetical protein WKF87_15995 [Chryseolinea sp.]
MNNTGSGKHQSPPQPLHPESPLQPEPMSEEHEPTRVNISQSKHTSTLIILHLVIPRLKTRQLSLNTANRVNHSAWHSIGIIIAGGLIYFLSTKKNPPTTENTSTNKKVDRLKKKWNS